MEPREAEIRERANSAKSLITLIWSTGTIRDLLGWLDEARRERDDAQVLAGRLLARDARLSAALERIARDHPRGQLPVGGAGKIAREALQAGRAVPPEWVEMRTIPAEDVERASEFVREQGWVDDLNADDLAVIEANHADPAVRAECDCFNLTGTCFHDPACPNAAGRAGNQETGECTCGYCPDMAEGCCDPCDDPNCVNRVGNQEAR